MPKITRGSALITALFIMTLVAIAATATSVRLQLDIYRTRITILSDQMSLAAQAVSYWAMSELSDSKNKFTQSDKAGKVLNFPTALQNMVPNLVLEGELYDLQARFNLNNLKDKKYLPVFTNLMTQTTNLPAAQRTEISTAVSQWINPFTPDTGRDEYVNYYLQQKPPYYPSQQLIVSTSEFRLIRGVSAEIYLKLSPFITALPETTPINLNTASREILLSLGSNMTDALLGEILSARGQTGIEDLGKLTELFRTINLSADIFTLKSKYFLSVARVRGEDLNLVNYVILKREENEKEGKIEVSVITDSFNTL